MHTTTRLSVMAVLAAATELEFSAVRDASGVNVRPCARTSRPCGALSSWRPARTDDNEGDQPLEAGNTRRMSASATPKYQLVLVSGEEGAGKSTIIRALLPHTPQGARIDAEDVGQTNPCPMNDASFELLRRNVAGLVENFWAAGYVNVVAGSFLRDYADYLAFRRLLTRPAAVFVAELLVDKDARDHRRVTRAKQTTQEWRDKVDLIPEDRTLRQATDADYRYLGVDTTALDVAETVRRITAAIPEIYAS
jgi:hypothetical protein